MGVQDGCTLTLGLGACCVGPQAIFVLGGQNPSAKRVFCARIVKRTQAEPRAVVARSVTRFALLPGDGLLEHLELWVAFGTRTSSWGPPLR